MPAARSVLNRRGRECDRHDDADDDGPLTAVLDTDSNRNGVSRRGRNHRQASPKKLSRKNSIFRLLLRSGFFLVILWSAIVLHLSSWTNLLDSPTVVGSGGVNSRQTNSYDASNQRRHNHHQEPFFYRLIPSRSSKLPSQQSLLLYPGGRSSSDPWEYGQKVKWPPPSAFEARRLKTRPNYMGLQFQSLSSSGSAGQGSDGHHHHYHHHKHLDFTRVILPDDDARYNDMKSAQLRTFDKNTNDEEVDPDDPQRYQPWDEQQPIEDTELTGGCFRLKYTHGIARYGTCNEFHAVSLDRPHEDNEYAIKYFGRGFFRQVWGLMDLETREAEAVMKVNRFFDERGFNNYAFQQTHHETLAMLLTHSSKLVMDIYGMCGTTTLVGKYKNHRAETGPPAIFPDLNSVLFMSISPIIVRVPFKYRQPNKEPGSEFEEHVMPNDWEWPTEEELKELKADGDVKPMNNLTAEQKLEYALAMAEGLAELHGNPFGTMVSHDVGFDQWLFSKRDGLLKMNDINKCRPLYFNKERNEYCKIWSHQVQLFSETKLESVKCAQRVC